MTLTPDDRAQLLAMCAAWGIEPRQVAADLRASKIMLSTRASTRPTPEVDAYLRDIERRLADELEAVADELEAAADELEAAADELEAAAGARTIEDLAKAGYTHVAIRCVPCRTTKCKPISQLTPQARALSLGDLAKCLKCQDCGTAPESANLSPWRASEAPGHPKPGATA